MEKQKKELSEETNNQIKLDYSLESPQQRNQLVKKIIANTPPQKISNKYLQILADYIIFAMDKKEKKEKKINTQNRMVTINKRETSLEGLATKFQGGQDIIYNLFTQDKNIIFTPKIAITQQDLAQIEPLRELREEILKIEEQAKKAHGRKKFLLQKQLIQMRKDQYVIKYSYKPPVTCVNATKSFNVTLFNDNIKIINGQIKDNSILSFLNSKHISALLCNYSKLKEQCWGKFYTDGYFLMQALDEIIDYTLKDKYPLYYDLLIYKIDGKTNLQIQKIISNDYGITYSVEYLSALWRNKIPKMIAAEAQKKLLIWYYTEKEKGKWKKCSKCGQIKLAHNIFFSKNNTSKDGWYSLCKQCRNKKPNQKKIKK